MKGFKEIQKKCAAIVLFVLAVMAFWAILASLGVKALDNEAQQAEKIGHQMSDQLQRDCEESRHIETRKGVEYVVDDCGNSIMVPAEKQTDKIGKPNRTKTVLDEKIQTPTKPN